MNILLAAAALNRKRADLTPTAPVMVSAVVSADGDELTLGFNKPMTAGAASFAGVVLDNGAPIVATYVSGDHTGSLLFSLSDVIEYGDTVTLDYTQPGLGMKDDINGINLATITDRPVTNNSEVGVPTFFFVTGDGDKFITAEGEYIVHDTL